MMRVRLCCCGNEDYIASKQFKEEDYEKVLYDMYFKMMEDHLLSGANNEDKSAVFDKKVSVKFLHNRFDIDLYPREI